MKLRILFGMLLCSSVAGGSNYQLQTLEEAHTTFHAATNNTMYAEAARQYEVLVTEEGIRNGELYYTLGNACFLAGDLGRAILNYRRAAQYLPHNSDVQHNLSIALEKRIDLIPEKERHPLAVRLLGWHFNTSTSLRWWAFTMCWLMVWGVWIWNKKAGRKESRISLYTMGVLSLFLIASITTDLTLARHTQPGVILAPEVLARKGDGKMYAAAFLEPLHSGTEFQRIEDRGLWWHIRLADGQTCWIPSETADTVGH
jgi:hypothetical protein